MDRVKVKLHKGRNNLATRWKKGQSGNPSGRPKILKDVQALFRQYTPQAYARLVWLAEHGRPHMAQLAAVREILDRAWGKPLAADAVTLPGAGTAEQGQNVVRTPLPAQSVEQWQLEAEAWRKSQAELHGSEEQCADTFLRSYQGPKGRVN